MVCKFKNLAFIMTDTNNMAESNILQRIFSFLLIAICFNCAVSAALPISARMEHLLSEVPSCLKKESVITAFSIF